MEDNSTMANALHDEQKTSKQDENPNSVEENDKQDGVHKSTEENENVPHVGMAFKTYEEVLEFYRRYAWHVGFDVRVRRTTLRTAGQYYSIELMCSRGGMGRSGPSYLSRPTAKTNCQANVQLKLQGDGLLHIKKVNLEHNHPVDPSMVKLKKRKRRQCNTVRENDEDNCSALIRKVRMCQTPVQEGGSENLLFSDKERKTSGRRERLRLQVGDAEAIYQYFVQMQMKNPNLFYSMDLDDEGHLRNVFWADAMSRAAFKYFGDVVLFDTTYLTSEYKMPFVLFVGVNNHGQLVLLGCGLLSDETAETYCWLFKTWLSCMSSHPPNALITDQCDGITEAVAKVFPAARHRLCLWQIMKKIPEKLRGYENYKAIKKELKKVVYDSYRAHVFEENWEKIIQGYGLEGNHWLNWLYENRRSWVPIYLKDTFWAGLSITQRGASMTTFFEGFVYPETSLKLFLSMYESAVKSKYEKEAQADFESFHKSRNLISKFYMEEQLSELYTHNMFKEFQDELKATMYCDVSLVKEDGPISTFEVKESVFLEDGNVTEYKDLEVIFNAAEIEVQCFCGLFQFRGILCRHALSVFKLQQVYEVPSRYIVDRWRKDIKLMHTMAYSSSAVVANNRVERYDNLSRHFLQVADVGMLSDEKYHLTLKLLGEVERFILNENNCGKSEIKIVSSETQATENAETLVVSQMGTSEGDKVLSASQVKRRGRPPKRRKESDENTLLSNTKLDDVGTSSVENHGEMLPIVPATSHLGSHIDAQESLILMGEVSPSDFSLGSHYGVQGNPQVQNSSQLGMLATNMFQGQYDRQTVGNHLTMQWIYQQMVQEAQSAKAPPDRRAG